MNKAERKVLIRERHLALITAGKIGDARKARSDALADVDHEDERAEHSEIERLTIDADSEDE